jgi:DedD protein
MAASTPTEQSEIRRKGRQRLVGAIAIVLLAVVFVPMVLDPEPRQERKEPLLAIPPKDRVPPLPAPVPGPGAAKAAASAKPQEAPKAAEPARVAAPVKAVEAPKPTPPAPAKSAAESPKLEGFAVQVGAFRDEEKLRQVRERLSAAKIVHFTERLAAGDLTRLRAGPYPTREAAEKARAAVITAGLEGQVVTLP